jgi:ribosomal protein L5
MAKIRGKLFAKRKLFAKNRINGTHFHDREGFPVAARVTLRVNPAESGVAAANSS